MGGIAHTTELAMAPTSATTLAALSTVVRTPMQPTVVRQQRPRMVKRSRLRISVSRPTWLDASSVVVEARLAKLGRALGLVSPSPKRLTMRQASVCSPSWEVPAPTSQHFTFSTRTWKLRRCGEASNRRSKTGFGRRSTFSSQHNRQLTDRSNPRRTVKPQWTELVASIPDSHPPPVSSSPFTQKRCLTSILYFARMEVAIVPCPSRHSAARLDETVPRGDSSWLRTMCNHTL